VEALVVLAKIWRTDVRHILFLADIQTDAENLGQKEIKNIFAKIDTFARQTKSTGPSAYLLMCGLEETCKAKSF